MSRTQKYLQYYQCTEQNKRGLYIAKNNQELAQKSYDEKLLQLTEKRYSQIKKLAENYEDDELEKIYQQEYAERQKLIRPVEVMWEQKVSEWKQKEYKGKEFQEGTPVILTEKGERVRSKPEKIMPEKWCEKYRHMKIIIYFKERD